MNKETRKNSERKRKCDDLGIDKGKIIKTEVEDTSGTESYESVPLLASSIKEELDVEIKSEPEENVEDLNDIPKDPLEAIKNESNIKVELFEESETCIQLFNNTTKIYENSNTASDIETRSKIHTSNRVNLNPTADINKPTDTKKNNEIQQNEELSTFNKPLKKKETNIDNSMVNKDEFDVFGNYIAKTLRSLPGELGVIAKTYIVKALTDFQIKALGKIQMNPLVYGVTSCQDPDCFGSS